MHYFRSLLLPLFILCITGVGQAQEQGYKAWSKDSLLRWSDLKGIVDKDSPWDASSYTFSQFKYKWRQLGDRYKVSFTVRTVFDTERSWVKPGKQSAELLKFEQVYFDINEFFTRKLITEFNSYKYTSDLTNEIAQIDAKLTLEKKAMQMRFIESSAFAGDTLMRHNWTLFVQDILANDPTIDEAIKREPVLALVITPNQKVWDPTKPIQWEDFKGRADDPSTYIAITYSGSNMVYRSYFDSGKYILKFEISSVFNLGRSWSKPAFRSPAVLKHEQVHFDITEFFTRQLIRALKAYTYTANYGEEVGRIRALNNVRRDQMQNLYDEQTDHSRNKELQLKWETLVAELLSKDHTIDEAFKKAPAKTVATTASSQ